MDSSGNIQLMGTRNFPRRESALHSEVEALRWAMENMLQHSTCQRFGTDCKELIAMVKDPQAWPNFADGIGEDRDATDMLPGFQHHSRSTGAQSDC